MQTYYTCTHLCIVSSWTTMLVYDWAIVIMIPAQHTFLQKSICKCFLFAFLCLPSTARSLPKVSLPSGGVCCKGCAHYRVLACHSLIHVDPMPPLQYPFKIYIEKQFSLTIFFFNQWYVKYWISINRTEFIPNFMMHIRCSIFNSGMKDWVMRRG